MQWSQGWLSYYYSTSLLKRQTKNCGHSGTHCLSEPSSHGLSNTSSNISKSGWATNHRRHTRPAQRCSWWYPQFTSASCVRLSSGSHCLGTMKNLSREYRYRLYLGYPCARFEFRGSPKFLHRNGRKSPDLSLANINFAEKTHANISNPSTHDAKKSTPGSQQDSLTHHLQPATSTGSDQRQWIRGWLILCGSQVPGVASTSKNKAKKWIDQWRFSNSKNRSHHCWIWIQWCELVRPKQSSNDWLQHLELQSMQLVILNPKHIHQVWSPSQRSVTLR